MGHLPWLAAGLTLFCAALGLMVQLPGVGGGYQVGIILSLTEIFNIKVEPATGSQHPGVDHPVGPHAWPWGWSC